jgi:hypothetical protein
LKPYYNLAANGRTVLTLDTHNSTRTGAREVGNNIGATSTPLTDRSYFEVREDSAQLTPGIEKEIRVDFASNASLGRSHEAMPFSELPCKP